MENALELIISKRECFDRSTALLVGISGIDASGKGTIAARISHELTRRRLRVALINVDGWLQPPHIRFSSHDPGGQFYRDALRFDDMFAQLIRPLRERRSISLTVQLTREPQNDFFLHTYDFSDIDVILLEGIFLYKRTLKNKYDLRLWVECSFATALQRAILRRQEGLPEAETIQAFNAIYFVAQRIHLALDEPKCGVDAMIDNEQSDLTAASLPLSALRPTPTPALPRASADYGRRC